MGFSGSKLAIALLTASVSAGGCSPSLGKALSEEGCQLHYTDDVPVETATTVLQFLVSEGFCAEAGRRVQITTQAEVLELRFATRAEVREDPAYLDLAKTFAAQLSGKALDGRPVDVAICDESLEVVTRSPGHRWGRHVVDDKCGIYVGPDLSSEQGARFLALVKEDLGCEAERSFRLAREAGALNLYFVLDDQALEAKESFHQARLTAGRASTVLFDGEPLTVHVADVYYVSKRSASSVVLGPSVTRGTCKVFQGEGLDPKFMSRFLVFIEAAGFCRSDAKVYRLSQTPEGGWHLAVVIRDGVPPAYERAFKVAFGLVAAMLRGAVFDLMPTYIDLCNPVFQECESIVGPDLGKAFLLGQCSVFHDPGIEVGVLDRLRGWMSTERFCQDAVQVVRLRRDGDGWAFHLAVRAQLHGSDELATLAKKLEDQLSREVFEGAAVRFVGTNEGLVPLK